MKTEGENRGLEGAPVKSRRTESSNKTARGGSEVPNSKHGNDQGQVSERKRTHLAGGRKQEVGKKPYRELAQKTAKGPEEA